MKLLSMANQHYLGRRTPVVSAWLPSVVVVVVLLALLSFPPSLKANAAGLRLSTTWTSTPTTDKFADCSQVRILLLRRTSSEGEPAYACGFYCRGDCSSFLFAVFVVYADGGVVDSKTSPQVVWAANRGRLVGANATLQLGPGGLVLSDAGSSRVWSSNTSGKPVAGLNLTEVGNLVLFGGVNNNQTIWESFANPTDSLLPGQKLRAGQSLTANLSGTNWTEGLYYLSATSTGLTAFIKSHPPLRYSPLLATQNPNNKKVDYFEFMNGSISDDTNTTAASSGRFPVTPSQFLRMESDGHLRVYQWIPASRDWVVVKDLLSPNPSNFSTCLYPTVCGRYGICFADGRCSCPQRDGEFDHFEPADSRKTHLGCKEVAPLFCASPQNHRFLRLDHVSYFIYDQPTDALRMDEEACRNTCSKNCSCKAAFFQYTTNTLDGACYLTSEVFSLRNNQHEATHYNSTAFIKVSESVHPVDYSKDAHTSPRAKTVLLWLILGFFFLSLFVAGCGCLLNRVRGVEEEGEEEEEREDDIEQVSAGTPRRFSLKELSAATNGFRKKVGRGGFGSVYEGRIGGHTVAVKRLDSVTQGKRQFLAEVQTVGKLHHVNLVKLIGYCAERYRRLLVYEFMPNRSLDRWIFSRGSEARLDWQTRCKIILGVARGLCYLHEDCSKKIAHLDVKPENILLDERFNAKLSDFGLAKLIERDQTHIKTRMRGTPGYMAPEWLGSMITEKADVYSFGVVVLEMICRRRNLDRSRPAEDMLLVALLKRKAESGGEELLDLVDASIKDADNGNAEVAMKMIQIAMWWLQEQSKRPSMATVAKALEAAANGESITNPNDALLALSVVECGSPLLPSVLSGPR